MQVELVGWIDLRMAREQQQGGMQFNLHPWLLLKNTIVGFMKNLGLLPRLFLNQIAFHFFYVMFQNSYEKLKQSGGLNIKHWTYPSALSSNKLVIFSLDTGPAASIIVLLFKVRVIFQLLWCL